MQEASTYLRLSGFDEDADKIASVVMSYAKASGWQPGSALGRLGQFDFGSAITGLINVGASIWGSMEQSKQQEEAIKAQAAAQAAAAAQQQALINAQMEQARIAYEHELAMQKIQMEAEAQKAAVLANQQAAAAMTQGQVYTSAVPASTAGTAAAAAAGASGAASAAGAAGGIPDWVIPAAIGAGVLLIGGVLFVGRR